MIAFGHLKAIVVDKGGQALLRAANIGHDAGVGDVKDRTVFIAVARRANAAGKVGSNPGITEAAQPSP